MEQRLIDGNDLLKHFSVSDDSTRYRIKDCDNFPITVNLEYVQKQIRAASAIDPIHAAGACYCGECKFNGIRNCLVGAAKKPTDFCSYGERKQNEILD